MALLRGKGDKQGVVAFSAATMRAMHKYLLKARKGAAPNFFQSEEGRPLQPAGLGRIVRRIAQRGGHGAHPHRFRRTAAVTFLRQGGDVLTLRRLLGHADLATTERYVALSVDDLVTAHRAHSPVDALIVREH